MNLAESIKEHGVIQPLVLKKEEEYICNNCRWKKMESCEVLELKEIPAIIMDLTDKEVLEISLIENIQREDLNPIEEAIAYKKLLNDFNLTQEEL